MFTPKGCISMCLEPHHCIFNHVMLFRDKHVCLGGIQTMPSLLYRYIKINSTKKNMIHKEINRLWVSCVSRWGCLSDSDSDVFANPECICTNKKIFDWEREKERKRQDAEHIYPGAMPPLYLTCACTHAGVFDLTIFFSTIVWNSFSSNSQSPRYSETRMT